MIAKLTATVPANLIGKGPASLTGNLTGSLTDILHPPRGAGGHPSANGRTGPDDGPPPPKSDPPSGSRPSLKRIK